MLWAGGDKQVTGTIDLALKWWADYRPNNRAIVVGEDVVTFAEFEQWTARVALMLLESGFKPGGRIAVFSPNSMAWCAAAIGIIRAGGVLVPLNYRYTQGEAVSVAEDCSPSFIIVGGDKAHMFDNGKFATLSIERVIEVRTGERVAYSAHYDPDAPVLIGYTSGSTAKPKGAVFTHRKMIDYALEAAVNCPEYAAGATSYNVAPLYTSGGCIQMIQFLNLGMVDILESEFDPERALRILVDEKVSVFAAVPVFWERIAAHPGFADAELSHIKLALVGGARVPMSLLETWRKKNVILRQLYGLTEAGGTSSFMPLDEAIDHPEQCGRGGIFTTHRIVDENGDDVPIGTPGEIVIRGPGIMVGYWNNPEGTKQAFFGDWLRTGDIGIMDEKRNMQVVDRLKDIIISGGLNIWPLDIEATIAKLDDVVEVAVIGAHDDKFGETPMAIIYSRSTVDPAAVVSHCDLHLANYKVPRYVVIRDTPLPRLATGKIAKRELRDEYRLAHETYERVR